MAGFQTVVQSGVLSIYKGCDKHIQAMISVSHDGVATMSMVIHVSAMSIQRLQH